MYTAIWPFCTHSVGRTAAVEKGLHRQSCSVLCSGQHSEWPGHGTGRGHCWFWHPKDCVCRTEHNSKGGLHSQTYKKLFLKISIHEAIVHAILLKKNMMHNYM